MNPDDDRESSECVGNCAEDLAEIVQLLVVTVYGPASFADGREAVVVGLGVLDCIVQVLEVVEHHRVCHNAKLDIFSNLQFVFLCKRNKKAARWQKKYTRHCAELKIAWN